MDDSSVDLLRHKRLGKQPKDIADFSSSIESQEPRPEGTGLGMVVLTQVLTRLSFNTMLLGLPVSGYKNVGMHTLVPTTSVEPLNTTLTKHLWDMPDMACRRVLNSYTGGLYHVAV